MDCEKSPRRYQDLRDSGERQRTLKRLADDLEERMVSDIRRAYHTEAREDERSLERVLTKLRADQASIPSRELTLPNVSRQSGRRSMMQSSFSAFLEGKGGGRWPRRAGALAAAVLLALLVGGLLTMLGVGHLALIDTVSSQAITSVTLSDNMGNASTGQSFMVGQPIWLTSMIDTKKTGSGVLTVKWYEDNRLLATSTHDFSTSQGQAVATATKPISLRAHQVFTQPGNGKAEVYWNGQLVTTLHFVIKGKPQKPA